ncbi:hypothetical protein [Gallaecimonas sp. GXIMD1310]|uniref:hypothetical protein n=1 Tax=Gallaecimonas sp. GXIMD1310 TaxID=3131926 RepID=UPI00324AD48D
MILRYSLLWFALAIIAIANGVLRQQTYAKALPELAAHQLSTVLGIFFTGVFVYWVQRVWPIASLHQAWLIGSIWLLATVLFEFVFGHYVAGHTWGRLLHDYNLLQGRLWLVFLLWVWLLPVLLYKSGH